MAKTITVTLSEKAEKYFDELMYGLEFPQGEELVQATESQAISHALEELAAFEEYTDDQVTNWLADRLPRNGATAGTSLHWQLAKTMIAEDENAQHQLADSYSRGYRDEMQDVARESYFNGYSDRHNTPAAS